MITLNDAESTTIYSKIICVIKNKNRCQSALFFCFILFYLLFFICWFFQICVRVPSVSAHFSALTYRAILGLVEQFKLPHPSSDSTVSLDLRSYGQDISMYFGWLSINASLGFINLLVNLEDDIPDGRTMKLLCQMLDVRYIAFFPCSP